jgi:hypothetical protein
MRPRMMPGDCVVGISSSKAFPRRFLFAARIEKRMTFADAYRRFADLRGPGGPIHVRPVGRSSLAFPDSHYEHIPGGNHPDNWRADIRTLELDAFFVCEKAGSCAGRWLGPDGPAVSGELLEFLRTCEVWGRAGKLSEHNRTATADAPVRHGRLYTGLHLETRRPQELLSLITQRCQPTGSPSEPPLRKGHVRCETTSRTRRHRRVRC